MIILIDSREKDLHIKNKLEKRGYKVEIRKLDFGDYSFIHNDKSYEKEIAIERKKSFDELISNLSKKDIARFEREFSRAKDTKMILFVEQSAEYFEQHKYRSKIPPKILGKKIRAFLDKHMIEFYIIKRVSAASFILEIFEKYIRERCVNDEKRS